MDNLSACQETRKKGEENKEGQPEASADLRR